MPKPNRLTQRIDGAALFSEATSVAGLGAGWARTWANGGAAGGDGQTLSSFSVAVGERLAVLSGDLRSGRYRPQPLREVRIPKPGKRDTRLLRIPAVRDRVAQSAMAQALSPRLDPEMEETSFAYRPGRGVAQALEAVRRFREQGYVWTVDADIEAFFDRIPIDAAFERLHRSVTESPASELIGLWLEHGARNGRGLAQGSPLSPLIANLYLDDLDEAFSGKGLRIVRYADDFVVLARDRPAAEDALDRLAVFLDRHGLALNRDKTALRDYSSTLRFLGQAFVRSWMLKDDADDEATTSAAALMRHLAKTDAQEAEAERQQAEEEGRIARAGHDPGLRVLALATHGRRLTLRNQSFSILEAPEEALPGEPAREILALHPTRVDRIELGPHVAVEGDTLRHALASGIPVAFTNGHGETLGHLAPVLQPRAGRHLAQARCILDPERRLDLARRLVRGRIANQRAFLRRINARRQLPAIATAAHALTRAIRRVRIATTVEELMGHEGLAAALYWRAFDRLLLNDFRLVGRSRRKRGDPINGALDMAASLLQRDLSAVIVSRGLHPGFGALHATGDARDACVYDLMEAFRAGLAESLVLTLANTGVLKSSMFSTLDDGTVRMGTEAQRALIRAYEKRCSATVLYPATGQRMTWRRIMIAEAERYARHVEGVAEWEPMRLNY